MTPSEIADWVERFGCNGRSTEAVSAIREQAEEVRELNGCRCELEAVSLALGSGVRFMDPTDGGSVTIAEQVARMRIAMHEAETKLKIATEALDKMVALYESEHDPENLKRPQWLVEALARIKEV